MDLAVYFSLQKNLEHVELKNLMIDQTNHTSYLLENFMPNRQTNNTSHLLYLLRSVSKIESLRTFSLDHYCELSKVEWKYIEHCLSEFKGLRKLRWNITICGNYQLDTLAILANTIRVLTQIDELSLQIIRVPINTLYPRQ